MSINPLANFIRFGWRPTGNGGSTPPPTGTDYRHERPRFIRSLDRQIVRFGWQPVGTAGGGGGGSTDFRHEFHMVTGLPHHMIRFGFRPVGSGGSGPVTSTAPHDHPLFSAMGKLMGHR